MSKTLEQFEQYLDKMKKYEHIGFEHVQDRKFKEKVYEHDLIRYPKNKSQEQR